ncbi:flagellar hook-basal body protein FliE [Pandoraea communis]|uniref:Flagellar hook-basal body complex protein FliE n=1 Tax=Pandoraea communis TaxID=2508297 RepID=A0A5E4YQ14_9BURK|nr:flagellar hook-basal body complex protein FliE [Pandoraea communis]VVE50475.1 flagellar hook-basal body protein FliE [Pandoraea communis]
MSIEATSAVEALLASGDAASGVQALSASPARIDFGATVTQGLAQVNEQLLSANTQMHALASGNVENLHQVMMRLEEAGLTFQLFMQVRNRVLEAYQEVMRMQV